MAVLTAWPNSRQHWPTIYIVTIKQTRFCKCDLVAWGYILQEGTSWWHFDFKHIYWWMQSIYTFDAHIHHHGIAKQTHRMGNKFLRGNKRHFTSMILHLGIASIVQMHWKMHSTHTRFECRVLTKDYHQRKMLYEWKSHQTGAWLNIKCEILPKF